MRRNAIVSLALHAAALRSGLAKYRSVAFMLTQVADVAVLLNRPSDHSATDRIEAELVAIVLLLLLGEGSIVEVLKRVLGGLCGRGRGD